MNANKGSQFGNQFIGKTQSTFNNAKNTLDESANDFTNASNQGAIKWDDVQGDVNNIVGNAGDTTSQEDVDNFKKYSNAQYQGPESFYDSVQGKKAQGAIGKAAQEANALQSEGGRFALLDQYFGRPKYNQGQKSLDNLLVQNTPGVGAKAQRLTGQANQLANDSGVRAQELDNLALTNKSATSDVAKNTKDALTNAATEFKTDLDSRYKTYKDTYPGLFEGVAADLSDDEVDQKTLDALRAAGFETNQDLYGLNINDFISKNPEASLGQFATDKDYAKYLALQQLAGEDATYLTKDGRTQAGSVTGPLSFDKERFSQAQAGQKAENDQRVSAANQELASFAPMGNAWLDSVNSRTPEQNIADLEKQKAQWRGSEMESERIGQLDRAIQMIQNANKSGRRLNTTGLGFSNTGMLPGRTGNITYGIPMGER
jgi:hypothetical protein